MNTFTYNNTVSRLALMLAAMMPLAAQTTGGRILGTIHDQTEGVLVGATVVIKDTQRGFSKTLLTDDRGDYVAADLKPGVYSVRAAAEGFKSVERPEIELQVDKELRVNLVLAPGDVAETLTVTEDIPLIETTNDVLGGTLSNRTINDLPLNGRDFQNLLVLRPGVARYPGGGIGSVSANGLRPEDNNYIVEGIDNNDPYFGQSVINGVGVQGTPATILPIDAIQEFNVEGNPPGEYGWKPGAVVNVALKSGTDALHGTTYYFGRNAALDARNFFNAEPDPQKPLRLHQFGGTLGGPVVKKKLFFFVGYEAVRDLVGVTQAVSSPASVHLTRSGRSNCGFVSAGDCANSIPDAIADLQAGGLAVSPLSLKLAQLFPQNGGTNQQGSSTILTGFPNTNRGDNGLGKVDYHLSDHHLFSGTYLIGDSLQKEQDAPVLQPEWESQAITRGQMLGGNWTWMPDAAWVNEVRLGYNRLSQSLLTADSNVNPVQYGINTGVVNPLNFGMPQITISGFLPMGGTSGWPQLLAPSQTFQVIDNATHTRGRHTVKFGGEIRRSSVSHVKDRFGKGRIRFGFGDTEAFDNATPLEDFLAGTPSDGRVFVGDSHRNVSFWSTAAFLQDDWRITPRLSLNLGLRYELNTVLKEANNLFGNFDPNQGLVQVGRQIPSAYEGDHNNFAPRLGLSWDPTGRARTVIRAGGSIMYAIPTFDAFIGQFNLNNDPGTIGINLIPTGAEGVSPGGGTIKTGVQSVPGNQLNWTTAGPVFDVPAVTCSPARPCDILGVDRHLRTPYVTAWNVNLQQALTANLSLQVAYVGNHATKLLSITDINQVNPALDDGSEQLGRPFNAKFPFLGFVNWLSNGYRSNYNALQTTLTERPFHGFSFLLGYTYSHALDQASDNRAPQAMNSTNPGGEYGSSDFDMRHRLTMSMTYDIHGRKSRGQMLEHWQLNSIVSIQTGQPWNVIDTGNDFSGTGEGGDRWNFFGDPAAFAPSPNGPIAFFEGLTNSACVARAVTPGLMAALEASGCYAKAGSVMIPPAAGTFGSMGRNILRGPGLSSWDLSVVKNWKLAERVGTQFRAEFFNVLNHPNFANPYGVNGTFFQVDPSVPNSFGCACATPDVAAGNPTIGTGGPRNIQVGLKVIF